MAGASIVLKNVCKDYKKKRVVEDVSIDIEQGDFLTILGPSGAGKTTVLKMIAGFESTTEGEILLNGNDISQKPTHKRNIGMLFQNYALFPHMTVSANIAFPLSIRKVSKDIIAEKVKESLKRVKLLGYEDRYPKELSGGQQQRVALARALVFNPPVLLLDEPMAALDKQLRKHMQLEIKQLHKELGITTISVTHDQEEALTMATKVCVMRDGKVVQIDDPESIYDRPNSVFVAKFIGEANVFDGKVVEYSKQSLSIEILNKVIKTIPKDYWFASGNDVSVVIRPEKISIVETQDYSNPTLDGTIEQIVYVGEAYKMKIRLNNDTVVNIKIFSTSQSKYSVGDVVKIGFSPEDMVVLPKQ